MSDKFDKVKYDNEYIKNNYDRLTITLPKGKKELYKQKAEKRNMSLTQLITLLLENLK